MYGGNIDAPILILKFVSRVWQSITDKITKQWFNNLMDCYASMQLVEANIKARNVKHARPHNPGSSRMMT